MAFALSVYAQSQLIWFIHLGLFFSTIFGALKYFSEYKKYHRSGHDPTYGNLWSHENAYLWPKRAVGQNQNIAGILDLIF